MKMNVLCILLLGAFGQDEFKCETKLDLVDKKDHYTFHVKVKTNLPESTLVMVSVLYHWKEDITENLTDYKQKYIPVRIKSGEFEVDAYKFNRKPFSGNYRVRITADITEQDNKDVISKLEPKVKDGKIEFNFDTSYGTVEDYRKEIKVSANLLQKDFKKIRRVYDDLREVFTKHQKKFDEKSWDNFDKELKEKLLPIEESNSTRFEWGFDIEKFGKMGIEHMVEMVKKLLGESKAALKSKKKEDLQQAMETMNLFVKYYDRTIEDLGLDSPDLDIVRPIIEGLDEVIKLIAEGKENKETLQLKGIQLCMKLSQAATLKGYQYVVSIQEKLELAIEDKSKVKELKDALEEFKIFAGIK